MNDLTPKQRIEKAHFKMMGHKATLIYSAVLMVGQVKVSDEIPTACTNGRDVMYGSAFVAKLSDPELVGLILHENLHKVYQHHWLWKHLWKEDARLANMAADYVINCEIVTLSQGYPQHIALPEGGLYDERFVGMSTQQVFDILKQEGAGGESLDEHNFDELDEETQTQVAKEIDQAVRQGKLLASKRGGDVSRGIEALTQPKVDWREQLREFMTEATSGHDDSTWRRPNRRWLAQDMYMPSAVAVAMGPVVFVGDTSGSMQELVSMILSEVVGVCNTVKPEVLHLLEVDSKVAKHSIFSREDLHNVGLISEFHGGGGTDMRTAFAYIDENHIKPEVVIVCTDGYTPWPTTLRYPTLWVMTTDVVAPVGSTIHVN